MRHIANYKWFWITIGAWCFIATVGAWALIYSPFQLDTRLISEFSTEINKSINKNQIYLISSPMGLSLETVTEKWEAKGWKNMSGRINLAAALLNMPKEYYQYFNQLVQIRAFESEDSFRILGLLTAGNGGETYQWVSEIPKKSLESQDPSNVDFPLKPPPESLNALTVKTKDMETSIWSLDSKLNVVEMFSRAYSAQGFSGRLLSKKNDESFFILRKGSIKLLALVSDNGKKSTILLAKIYKI